MYVCNLYITDIYNGWWWVVLAPFYDLYGEAWPKRVPFLTSRMRKRRNFSRKSVISVCEHYKA